MIITLDFETYYDSTYTLKELTTEAYIRDKRFETIGVGIAVGSQTTRWYSGDEVELALRALPWEQVCLLAFNTAFDGAILAWRYGIYPAFYLDAQGMARALNKTYKGASLSVVADLCGVGTKGTYVVQAKGKHLKDFTPSELAAYGEYCCQDVALTRALYKQFLPDFPVEEAKVQDRNLRLFFNPLLQFDALKLSKYYDEVVEKKETALRAVATDMGMVYFNNEAKLKTALASNPQFAELLRNHGVEPPTKLSPTTGKETYAFAKTDQDFVELLEHENSVVQTLVATRLGVRSTIEETRAETFIDIATRGPWPVQYTYCAAGTTRFGGAGGANPQNLKRGGTLRDAVLPPPGHDIIVADLRQIEARVVNYWAEQDDVVQAFRDFDAGVGRDVYCLAAEKIFRRTVDPTDTKPRLVGKISELSLGFGGGWKAFKQMLFAQAGISMQQHECQSVVDIYRGSHKMIAGENGLWKQGEDALHAMLRGQTFSFGREGLLVGEADGIRLPSGLKLCYPELRQKFADGKTSFVYTKGKKPTYTYGSKVVQNVVEALARLVLVQAWLRLVERRVWIVMHTHDELVAVSPHKETPHIMQVMHEEMTREVPWAPGLPVACEVKSGKSYGEAKG